METQTSILNNKNDSKNKNNSSENLNMNENENENLNLYFDEYEYDENKIESFLENFNFNSFIDFMHCFDYEDLKNQYKMNKKFEKLINDKNNENYLKEINLLKNVLDNHKEFEKTFNSIKYKIDNFKINLFYEKFPNVNLVKYHNNPNLNYLVANYFNKINLSDENILTFGHLFDWLFIFYHYYNYPKFTNNFFDKNKVNDIFQKNIVSNKLLKNETFIAGLIITENFEIFKKYDLLFSNLDILTIEKVAEILNNHYCVIANTYDDYKHKKFITYLLQNNKMILCKKFVDTLPNVVYLGNGEEIDNQDFLSDFL